MLSAPGFFRFTICGIPELGSHCEAGVTHVLSILDPECPDPPEFEDYAPHRRLALRFHDIIDPMPGRHPPTRDDVIRLLAFGRELSDARDLPSARALPRRRIALDRRDGADPGAGAPRPPGPRGA